MRHAKSSRIVAALVATVAFALSVSARAQATPKADTDKPLRFEIVSIRPSGPSSSQGMQFLPDGLQSMAAPIEQAIYLAYVPAPFFKHLEEVKGFPAWAVTDKYDLVAKVAPEDAERWRSLNLNAWQTSPVLQSMLRTLLAERCNLQLHSQDTRIDAFALVRRPNAPPLTESTQLPTSGTIMQLTDGAQAVFEQREGERTYTFYNTPMPVLTTFIGIPSKRPVEDHTDLKGRYKFVLHAVDAPSSETDEPQADRPVPYNLQPLGLTVETIKVKSTLWTIDHLDRPTPN